MTPTLIIDTGSGNLRSVQRALEAAGSQAEISRDPERVLTADRIVVPGQGAFESCMRHLRDDGLDEAICEHIRGGKPYIGICLGLQILFEESEEHGPVAGLGLLPGRVVRLDSGGGLRSIPHMGWNDVQICRPHRAMRGIQDGSHFYFVHSYHVEVSDESAVLLRSDYGPPFVAAVCVDNIFACQFHPEKSQTNGLRMLRNLARE